MINLIPKEEKKRIVKVFYYKLAVLFLMVVSMSLFFAIIAISPSYILSLEKNNIIDLKLEQQKNELIPSIDQQTLVAIKDLNSRLDLIENAESKKFTVSEKVINAIILKKIPNIKITNISYASNSGNINKIPNINIQGDAPSREVLLMFRQSLENSVTLKQVNLPISNFVKGSNIQFYLSLIPS